MSPHPLPARGQKWRRRGSRGTIGRRRVRLHAGCCRGLQRGSITQRSDDLSPHDATVGRTNTKLLLAPACLRVFCVSAMLLALSRPQQLRPRKAPPRAAHHSRKPAQHDTLLRTEYNLFVGDAQPRIRGSDRRAGANRPCLPETSRELAMECPTNTNSREPRRRPQLPARVSGGATVTGPRPTGTNWRLRPHVGWLRWAGTRQDPRILPLARPAS